MIRPLLALAQTSGIDSLDPPISKLWILDIYHFPHAPGGILRILLRRQCFALLCAIVGHRGDLSEFISGTSPLKRPLVVGPTDLAWDRKADSFVVRDRHNFTPRATSTSTKASLERWFEICHRLNHTLYGPHCDQIFFLSRSVGRLKAALLVHVVHKIDSTNRLFLLLSASSVLRNRRKCFHKSIQCIAMLVSLYCDSSISTIANILIAVSVDLFQFRIWPPSTLSLCLRGAL